MLEIYLISLLDGLRNFFIIGSILSILACVIVFVWTINEDTYDYENRFDPKPYYSICKKLLLTFVAFLTINVFVPSTKDAYVILGVGTTLDYVKNNETIKQLPDKAVLALDKWLDEQTKEE